MFESPVRRPRVLGASALGLLVILSGGGARAAATELRGPFTVDVNDHGLVVAVPDSGLQVNVRDHGLAVPIPEPGPRTVDGPPMELRDGFAEWFGLYFREGSVEHAFVGVGTAEDPAGRTPVEAVELASTDTSATVTTRAGPMEVRTELGFALHVHAKTGDLVPLFFRGTKHLLDGPFGFANEDKIGVGLAD